jgi:hypothetical protein
MGDDNTIEQRLTILERWRTAVEVALGKQEVDKDYINKRFDAMEADLKELKNSAKKLNYTVYAAVIAYIIKYALDGGLAHKI